ncbi:MAG: tetratricopeptide repeat-containing sensor histidine kinase, partial [Bacteroidetes bacterium]|nr:tetratricopeptide repeat-containing sensor histidine kinase [Bacteroidota bacterium]
MIKSWFQSFFVFILMIIPGWLPEEGKIFSQVNIDSLRMVWRDTSQPDSSRAGALFELGKAFNDIQQLDSIMPYAEQLISFSNGKRLTTGLGNGYQQKALAWYYRSNYDSAIAAFSKALDYYTQSGKKQKIAATLNNLGVMYNEKGEPEKSKEYYLQNLKICIELQDYTLLGKIYHNLGLYHENKGKYDSALYYYHQGIVKSRLVQNWRQVAHTMQVTGIVFQNLSEYDSAHSYFLNSLDIRKKEKDTLGIADCLHCIGVMYKRKGQYDSAFVYILESLELYKLKRHQFKIITAKENLGVLHGNLGEFDEAIKYNLEALAFYEKTKNRRQIALATSRIGENYSFLEMYEEARTYYKKSFDIFEELEDKRLMMSCLNDIGSSYLSQKEFKKARPFIERSISIGEEVGEKHHLATAYNLQGVYYYNQDQYEQAIPFFQKSITLSEVNGNQIGAVSPLLNIARYLRKNKNYEEAIRNAKRALKHSQESDYPKSISSSSQLLSALYKDTKQYDRALEMYELHIMMRDSLVSEENQRAIFRQGYAYQYQQKALSDSLNFVQQQVQQELAYKYRLIQRNYLIWAAIGLGLFSILFLRYRHQRNAREQARLLEQQEIEARNLRDLNALKTRLYANITHEFRTPLTVILGMAEEAQTYFSERDKEAFTQAMEMIRRNGSSLLLLINQMLDLARLESGSLPVHYQKGEIVAYLRYLCESFQSYAAAQGLQLTVYSEIESQIMDHDPEKLLSIISNLIANAIKFTPPGGKIIFHISLLEDHLQIKVQDSGIGILPEDLPRIFDRFFSPNHNDTSVKQGAGLGLALVKELVELMDGSITVQSQPGNGSTFTLLLPIRQEAESMPDSYDMTAVRQQIIPFFELKNPQFSESG